MKTTTMTALAIVVFWALIVLAGFMLMGCGPKCKSGHYITVHVPETSVPNYALGTALDNEAMAYIEPIVTPAHDEQQFLCDVYEASK